MNKANKKKAIFLDIDGTLIGREHDLVREDREAMEEASRKGHYLFLNTGRSFANIPPDLLLLPSLNGVAAGGGAHVLLADSPGTNNVTNKNDVTVFKYRYKTIYHKYFSDELLEKIFAWYGKNTKCCILEGERDCYSINRSSWFFTVNPPVYVNSMEDFRVKSRGDFITKLSLDNFVLEDEKRILEPALKLNLFSDYAEGIIEGENKAKAMETALRHLGLKREDSIAIGDSINDIDMIRFAGLGIAMGNACAELKAAAGAITGNCGEGGVSGALRKYVL